METPELVLVSLIGYIIAFGVLIVLALVMRLITAVFPEAKAASPDDGAIIAAISTTYQAIAPGTAVTRLEETK